MGARGDPLWLAGALYDHMGKSYLVAFILAGVPPILAGVAMTYITAAGRRARRNSEQLS